MSWLDASLQVRTCSGVKRDCWHGCDMCVRGLYPCWLLLIARGNLLLRWRKDVSGGVSGWEGGGGRRAAAAPPFCWWCFHTSDRTLKHTWTTRTVGGLIFTSSAGGWLCVNQWDISISSRFQMNPPCLSVRSVPLKTLITNSQPVSEESRWGRRHYWGLNRNSEHFGAGVSTVKTPTCSWVKVLNGRVTGLALVLAGFKHE